MKKFMILLSALAVLTGCRNEKYEIVIPMSDIWLAGPADGTAVDLNDMDIESVTFSWDRAIESGAMLIFSNTVTLKTNVQIEAGTGISFDVTPMDLNTIASQLGVTAGSSGTLYWTVKAADNISAAASSVFTINVDRIVSKLRTPQDQSTVELLVDKPDATVVFSWDGEGQQGSDFSIVFSTDANMSDNVRSIDGQTVENSSIILTADLIQNEIERLDMPRFTQNTVYWNVRNNTTSDFVSRASGVVNIVDMLRFTDIRGEETQQYRVVRLEYNGETQYWMAENLRTEFAPDGTKLEKGVEYQALSESEPSWCSDEEERALARKAYGCYYTLDAALKACPEGWQLPSYKDWRALFDAAGVAGSYIVLKSLDWYVPADAEAEKADELWGAWGLNLVSCGQWWGNGNPADMANANSQHIYLVATDVPDNSNYFVQSAADSNFWPQTGTARGASVRYYYVGK